MNFDHILKTKKVIITCGTGGVGKTTVSAALGLRAASLGKKVLVITIDPAKRLVTALGLKQLGHEPENLTPVLTKCVADFKGEFSALMPDARDTFNHLIETLAPNEELAERVKKNQIFKVLGAEHSGANDYMGLWRLLSLKEDSTFDCIILDTPPNRNTLSFLHSPKLIARFFEEKFLRFLILPANKILSVGIRKALKGLESLTGKGFVGQMLDLAGALFEVQDAFFAYVKKADDLLKSEEVGFVLVTAPRPDTIPEFLHLVQLLKKLSFSLDGVVLNRTVGYFKEEEPKEQPDEKNESTAFNQTNLEKALDLIKQLQNKEKEVVESLQDIKKSNRPEHRIQPEVPMACLPELTRDIHSLQELLQVSNALADTSTFSWN